MLPSLRGAVLPSEVSPAALDKSFSARSLGLHCVEVDELDPGSSPVALLNQNLLCARRFHVLDVEPLGSAGSAPLSSPGSV